ncbi:MAG: hypothetical protein BroJett040_14120 [Oligoflexia bacterium]|nr:MAG: hypothetical protein BroJett040_14120 [Oligoflexia bacterium]
MKKSSVVMKTDHETTNTEAKMEIKADTLMTDKKTARQTGKQHIQKVTPVKTTVVSDPGGCRPTGT